MGYKIEVTRIWERSSDLFGGYRAKAPEVGIEACGLSEEEVRRVLMDLLRHRRVPSWVGDFG